MQASTLIVKFYHTFTDWVSFELNEVRTLAGRSVTWIKNQWPYVKEAFQTCLQKIIAIAKRQFANFYRVGKPFLECYRWQIIGGIALVTVALYYLWKKREARKLKEVNADLTLNLATLSVEVLERKQKPINVMLTIVIDKSSSMNGGRQQAVAEAICGILTSSKDFIEAPKNAKIRVAITAFNGKVENIQEMVQLTSENIQIIKDKVNAIRSEGGTDIITGLDGGLKEVEKVKDCDHTLIVLTDGKSGDQGIEAIHKRFASAKVKVFAIGIGEGHNRGLLEKLVDTKYKSLLKKLLEKLIQSNDRKFEGKYIDMTQNTSTIAAVVADIYAQAISSHYLHLTAPLEPGTWTVAGKESVAGSTPHQSSCDIGLLSEGKKKNLVIQIHPEKLKTSLDLSKLVFTLSNVSGQSLLVPWKGNPIINTDVITAAT